MGQAQIVLRGDKGESLSHEELDSNFQTLDNKVTIINTISKSIVGGSNGKEVKILEKDFVGEETISYNIVARDFNQEETYTYAGAFFIQSNMSYGTHEQSTGKIPDLSGYSAGEERHGAYVIIERNIDETIVIKLRHDHNATFWSSNFAIVKTDLASLNMS